VRPLATARDRCVGTEAAQLLVDGTMVESTAPPARSRCSPTTSSA